MYFVRLNTFSVKLYQERYKFNGWWINDKLLNNNVTSLSWNNLFSLFISIKDHCNV